jgi:cell division transport system ATP-binding protein
VKDSKKDVNRVIKFDGVQKEYDNGVLALHNISFEIPDGDFVFIIGPSGAGKSTVLKMIYREEKPTAGSVYYHDLLINKIPKRKLHKLRRELGVVFQDFKLLPKLTVYENIAFALEVISTPKKEVRKRVMQLLDIVGLKSKAKYYPNQLSGGEQQRVSIARALINRPRILICDEPTGNLDPNTSLELMQIIDEINKRGTTVIMATHDKEIVNLMKKRVISLEHGHVLRDEKAGVYHYD